MRAVWTRASGVLVEQAKDLGAVFFDRADAYSGDPEEFGGGGGLARGDGSQGIVGEDAEGRDVAAFGFGQAPGSQGVFRSRLGLGFGFGLGRPGSGLGFGLWASGTERMFRVASADLAVAGLLRLVVSRGFGPSSAARFCPCGTHGQNVAATAYCRAFRAIVALGKLGHRLPRSLRWTVRQRCRRFANLSQPM